jgi:acyl-CoA synthetase (AMP-forming)/AMP-acid ligase II
VTIVDTLEKHAESRFHETAFTYLPDGEVEGEKRSFGELDRHARAVAHRLALFGVSGRPVLLLVPELLKFIDAFIGSCYAGAIPVAAIVPKPNRSFDTIRAISADAGVAAAIVPSRAFGYLKAALPENLRDVPWLYLDEIDYSVEEPRRAAIKPDDIAFLQYTSGSTGIPKGVVVKHSQLMHNETVIMKAMGFHDRSVMVSWLPFYHDMGLIGSVLQPLHTGFHCVIIPPATFIQKPVRWLQAISKYRGTSAGAPSFAYDLCIARSKPEEIDQLDLSTWTVAYSGAEPVRADMIRRFTKVFAPAGFKASAFYPCYGLAECTLFATGIVAGSGAKILRVESEALSQKIARTPTGDEPVIELVGCGVPGEGIEIVIVDPETRKILPDDVVGEIWISGASVAAGYYKKPELTEETFGAAPAGTSGKRFLRSGDLGFWHEGQVFIAGRIKDVIIIRGRNHYPQDLELTAQRTSPFLSIGAGAVVAIEKDGQVCIALVQEVTREGWRSADADELAAGVREAIATEHGLHVHEVALIKTGALPRTSSGKVRRSLCAQMLRAGEFEVLQTSESKAIAAAGG